MAENFGANETPNRNNLSETYSEYLNRAVAACEAGDLVLGMHLYLAAYEKAVVEPTIPDGMALTGLREAWRLACELKERSMAEYVFEKMEPYLTGEEIAACAQKLQNLALDRLEQYGFSREELEDMAQMITQDFIGDGSVVKVESISIPHVGPIGVPAMPQIATAPQIMAMPTGTVPDGAANTEEHNAISSSTGNAPASDAGAADSETPELYVAPEAPEAPMSAPIPAKPAGKPSHVDMAHSAVDDFNPYDYYRDYSIGKSYHAATNEGSGAHVFTRDEDRAKASAKAQAEAIAKQLFDELANEIAFEVVTDETPESDTGEISGTVETTDVGAETYANAASSATEAGDAEAGPGGISMADIASWVAGLKPQTAEAANAATASNAGSGAFEAANSIAPTAQAPAPLPSDANPSQQTPQPGNPEATHIQAGIIAHSRAVPQQAASNAAAAGATAVEPPVFKYENLVGYDEAISVMRDFGIGLQHDRAFLDFVGMLNERHGLDRAPALDTLLIRAACVEDATRFVDATIGEIGLPVLRMSMEEGMQGMPLLCVTTQGSNRPRMNHAHNQFEAPAILVLDDLDSWFMPSMPENVEGVNGFMLANISRGAREAVNMIRSAVENPDIYVLSTATTTGDPDPFFYEMLEPLTVIDIGFPTEKERDDIWKEIAHNHPSMRSINRTELVKFSDGLARYDIYIAAREAIEEAYKIGLIQRRYVSVTPHNIFEKLAACQPLDSESYLALEDKVISSFQSELEHLEDLLGGTSD